MKIFDNNNPELLPSKEPIFSARLQEINEAVGLLAKLQTAQETLSQAQPAPFVDTQPDFSGSSDVKKIGLYAEGLAAPASEGLRYDQEAA